jgi:hypothetical protein
MQHAQRALHDRQKRFVLNTAPRRLSFTERALISQGLQVFAAQPV